LLGTTTVEVGMFCAVGMTAFVFVVARVEGKGWLWAFKVAGIGWALVIGLMLLAAILASG